MPKSRIVKGLLSFDDYAAGASRGRVRGARNDEESLKSLIDGDSQAQELRIPVDEVEADNFLQSLRDQGLVVRESADGTALVGKTESAVDALEGAETALEYGRAFGYSEDDIMAFYTQRRRDPEAGYREYLSDLEYAKKRPGVLAENAPKNAGLEPDLPSVDDLLGGVSETGSSNPAWKYSYQGSPASPTKEGAVEAYLDTQRQRFKGGLYDGPLRPISAVAGGALGVGALSAVSPQEAQAQEQTMKGGWLAPKSSTAQAVAEEQYGTIKPPEYPWLASAVTGARDIQRSLEGSPASLLFPESIVNAAERWAYGEEADTMDKAFAPLEMMDFVPGMALAAKAGKSAFRGTLDDVLGSPSKKLLDEFDPRFDPRKKEVDRLSSLDVGQDSWLPEPSTFKLSDFEGRPFVTSMSDRTAAGGRITDIKGTALERPVTLYGGQDYMLDPMNPGQVWASAKKPSSDIARLAGELQRTTGEAPLYMPWRMAPTGGDFAHMTGETMLSYAQSAMGKGQKRSLNSSMRKLIPDWPGIDDPRAVEVFMAAPDSVRKSAKNMLDVEFRDAGGLSIGEARLAVADPKQVAAPDGGTMNVGEIDTSRPLILDSGHPSYPVGVPGTGLGRIEDPPLVTDLLMNDATRFDGGNLITSNWGAERGISGAPATTDLRALQMKPYGGILDDKKLGQLSAMGYNVGNIDPGLLKWLGLGAGAAYVGSGLLEDEVEESGVAERFKPRLID